jgi:hypothetical protein
MKKPTLLLIIFSALTAVYANAQQPVEYSGAEAQFPESRNYFLTKDSYEKVKAFYVNKYGNPDHESNKDETERSATFFYEETIFEPRGIHLSEKMGNSRSVVHVFSELKGLIVREVLTRTRYDEIEKKYRHLQNYYYVRGEDETIYKKYYKMLGASGTEAMNTEETLAKAQKLIMAGKIEEGKALLEGMRDGMTVNMEYAGSEKAIDSWIDCLEKLEAAKYPVQIRIDR